MCVRVESAMVYIFVYANCVHRDDIKDFNTYLKVDLFRTFTFFALSLFLSLPLRASEWPGFCCMRAFNKEF